MIAGYVRAGVFGLALLTGRAEAQESQRSLPLPQVPPVAVTADHTGTAPPAAERRDNATPAIDLSAVYTAEVIGVSRGGLRRGARYLDNLDVTLTIDAERAWGWQGVTLFAYGLYNNGTTFSAAFPGDVQTVSNIETGVRAARLYEAWIDGRVSDRASIRFGLYDLNSEFDTTEAGQLSILSSHGIGPDFSQSGQSGPSIFPVTSLALRGEYRPDDRWLARVAVLDGVPGDPAHPARTAIKLGGRDGALVVAEVDYLVAGTKAAIGAWRYTAHFPSIETPPDRPADPVHSGGIYLLAERRLTGAKDADLPGLSAFARIGMASGRANPIARYMGGGLVYTGLLDEAGDRLGITVARAEFGRPYRRAATAAGRPSDRAETIFEATYRAPLADWLTVQPDLMYVVDPGGDPAVRNAMVLALRVEMGF